jgi:hypothetical protein
VKEKERERERETKEKEKVSRKSLSNNVYNYFDLFLFLPPFFEQKQSRSKD